MKLTALKRWAEEQETLGNGVNIQSFTFDVCKKWQRELSRTKDLRVRSNKRMDNGSKERLENFIGRAQHWERSKRALKVHLNQIKNEKGVTMYYVIWNGALESIYRGQNVQIGAMAYDTELQGDIYEGDVFRTLQTRREWTNGGTDETYTNKKIT